MNIFVALLLYLLLTILVGSLLLSSAFRHAFILFPKRLYHWVKRKLNLTLLKLPVRVATNPLSNYNSQHVWTVVAVIVLLIAPILAVISSKKQFEIADYSAENDTITNYQIKSLLDGEQLEPPPEPPAELFDVLDAELAQAAIQMGPPPGSSSVEADPDASSEGYGLKQLKVADRKWSRMNQIYAQRLLATFKIMKDQYGYDMVLLEGYRSPERQIKLASQGAHVTKATAYKSYHQFGLAADCAFLRDGKIVITEKDPWAMKGYQLYGQVAESAGLTWGGRWKMMDLGHTEFKMKGILGNANIAKEMTGG